MALVPTLAGKLCWLTSIAIPDCVRCREAYCTTGYSPVSNDQA